MVIGVIYLLTYHSGVGELNNPSYPKRMLSGFVIITGIAGVIANLIAYLDHRKQAKP